MDLFHLHEAFKYYSVFMHIHFGRHNSSKEVKKKGRMASLFWLFNKKKKLS